MEANELRVGSLIKGITGKSIFSVTSVTKTDSFTSIHADRISGNEFIYPFGGNHASMMIAQFEPIPLTEEWLIRFRFDFYKNTFWYKGFCYSIDVVNGVFILYHDKSSPFHGIETKYVHQLQNLYFALTGQELTFNK